jgi:tRNA(Leu) C34 or U34 (ribose-2'-O)-methylase TrmL
MSTVLLIDPKYPHNVGAILRTCSCYGIPTLRFTGTRMLRRLAEVDRIPREERMKGYRGVDWKHSLKPFDELSHLTPVAIEVRENSENLPQFDHIPHEDLMYVFGPEDGSLPAVIARHCHRFVSIPTRHCLNLATSVATVLYDRQVKLDPNFRCDMATSEDRGWSHQNRGLSTRRPEEMRGKW